jgi:hypothetical protein
MREEIAVMRHILGIFHLHALTLIIIQTISTIVLV